MILSGKSGVINGTSGRFVLGMVLIAWLNIAAQPCLMAMELATDTLLVSEPTVHSEHDQHASHVSDSHHCAHCPPVASELAVQCEAGSAASCEIFPGYNVDGRHFEQQAKDVSPIFVMSMSMRVCSTFVRPLLPRDGTRANIAGDPPLNIQYCVFLK